MGPSKNVRFIDGRVADSGEYQTNTEACMRMHENSGLLEGPGWLLPAKPPVVNDSMDVDEPMYLVRPCFTASWG